MGCRGVSGGGVLALAVMAGLAPVAAVGPRNGAGAGAGPAAFAQDTTRLHPALHVIPFPSTPDASPRSQIIFSSLVPSDVRSVIVTGSSSGLHPGRLVGLPDRAGTGFVPERPFTPGEKVSVQAILASAAAGAAEGAPGMKRLSFSFRVGIAVPLSPAASRDATAGARSSRRLRARFHSQPQLDPPPVHVNSGPAPGSDDIFLTPKSEPSGPMILNRWGQVVWFHPLRKELAFNLEVQRYLGQPVLTWWQGSVVGGYGANGQDVILNRSYRQVTVLHAAYGYSSDLHEFQITPQGTALIAAFAPVRANLSGVGGPSHGSVRDSIIQELDIRTDRILWEWHALSHVPLSASYRRPTSGPYDYFHLNSIQQLPGHRLLISARNTSAIYLIDEPTGRVTATLGGRHSSFRMGAGASFGWQHDATLERHGPLTVFDDGFPDEHQSSAKELMINRRTNTVTLVQRDTHYPPLVTGYEGSAQLLPNRDMFVGWGTAPDFSEYTPDGRQVFNASFALGVDTYRAYRFAWTGQPTTRPALAVAGSAHVGTWLYASWNGATQVAAWRVLGGPGRLSLRVLVTKRRTGFETAIRLPGGARYLQVQALDAHGRDLRQSLVVAAPK